MSSKFLTESTGEKIVKIGQYLAKIWTKYDSLVFFWATLYVSSIVMHYFNTNDYSCTECNSFENTSISATYSIVQLQNISETV